VKSADLEIISRLYYNLFRQYENQKVGVHS